MKTLNQSLRSSDRRQRQQKSLKRFCRSILEAYGSLHYLPTAQLANEYRSFFGLPFRLNDEVLRKHCRQIGVPELFKMSLPPGLGGFSLADTGSPAIVINSDQWAGTHHITFFHEVFEILNSTYSEVDKAFKPLSGVAKESRADKFGTCMVLPENSGMHILNLIQSVPILSLHLGEQIVPIITNRLKEIGGSDAAWSSIHYAGMTNCYRGGNGRVVSVYLNRSKAFLPRKSRKVFQSILPKFGDLTRESWIARQVIDYQGPVIVKRLTGFDLNRYHDLSVLCVPTLTDGQITNMWVFVFRADAYPDLEWRFGGLHPRIIEQEFQRL